MSILDDTALFAAIIKQGGFSHAARYLNVSNGLISRRITQLEKTLGVSLIKRTTRQLTLTPEGELFLAHAQRIQQELDSALVLIHASANKPKGSIRISAPTYFGRHYLTPILIKFLAHFQDIKIDLLLNNQVVDPIKENMDLTIRSSGYLNKQALKDSSLHIKLLLKETIKLYASPDYLLKQGEPKNLEDLFKHKIIGYSNSAQLNTQENWLYFYKNTHEIITLSTQFNCNDIETGLIACGSGYGIGRFTDLHIKTALEKKLVQAVLTDYEWGEHCLYAVYSHQQTLPKRCQLLLEFIYTHLENLN